MGRAIGGACPLGLGGLNGLQWGTLKKRCGSIPTTGSPIWTGTWTD